MSILGIREMDESGGGGRVYELGGFQAGVTRFRLVAHLDYDVGYLLEMHGQH